MVDALFEALGFKRIAKITGNVIEPVDFIANDAMYDKITESTENTEAKIIPSLVEIFKNES